MDYQSWSVVFGEQPSAAKWNILGTNDAYFASIVASDVAYGTWTPVFVNWAVGTGGSVGTTAAYTQVGSTVFWTMTTTLGSSGFAVTPNATFSLPVEAHANVGGSFPIGRGTLTDVSTGSIYDAGAIQASSTTALFTVYNSGTAHLTVSGINATTPITFAAGDSFKLSGFYQAVTS